MSAISPLEAWLEAFNERAAILEFDGGLSRLEAEKQALATVGAPPSAEHIRPVQASP